MTRVNQKRVLVLALSAMLCVSLAPSVWGQQNAGVMTRSAKAYPTGDPATSMLLLERTIPAQIRVGTSTSYEIHLKNLTNAPLENIVLVEQLPPDFEVGTIVPTPASKEGRKAQWNLSRIGPTEMKVIRISGKPTKLGKLSACATVTFSTQICLSTDIVKPALKLTKSAPSEVIICDPIPLKFVVTNTGNGPALEVKVKDNLPAGWTTQDGKTSLLFDAGTLQPNQSREFTATVKSSKLGSFTNKATALESGGLTASASTQTVVRKPILNVTKTGPSLRYVGRPAKYEITVSNTGDAPANNTVLVDTVPAGTTVMKASNNGQAGSGSITWNLGTINTGGSKKVTVTLKPNTIGTIKNTATATAYCAEAKASASTVIKGIPAILLELVDVEDPIEVGSNVTYIITVTNQGSAPGTNIVIKSTLAEEQTFVSADGPTKHTAKAKIVTYAPLPPLASKAKATYKMVVKGTKAADVRFTTELTSDQLKTPVKETESTHFYE